MPSQLQPCLRTQSPANTLLETKRHQWKAASARYYENHPEVREKKRLKMAEQRAAKKASRRRWDPPRKSRSTKDDPRAGSPFARNSSRDGCLLAGLSDEDLQATDLTCDVIWDPDPHVPSPENAAAESLLFLHAQQAKANPGVCQSTHSSEPEKSSNSGPQPSWKSDKVGDDKWTRLAPNYDSSDDD